MKKKIITVFAIAAFVMGGTLITPNSSNNTVTAKELPDGSFPCTWGESGDACPNDGHGCTCD